MAGKQACGVGSAVGLEWGGRWEVRRREEGGMMQ